jgi:hypothetical protein
MSAITQVIMAAVAALAMMSSFRHNNAEEHTLGRELR